MKFSIFGYTVTIEKDNTEFDAYDPNTWSNHHKKKSLQAASKFDGSQYISRIKAVRVYARDTFGEYCGLKNAKEFIDSHGKKGELKI